MSEIQLGPMHYFILAAVSRAGLRSLYELRSQAGVEPGAIRLVVANLERDGLLRRSEQQQRRRRLMTVTEVGERRLASEWRDCLASYLDAESVLRASAVALLMAGTRDAVEYLESMGHQHQWSFTAARTKPQSGEPPINWYDYMRLSWEIKRREAAGNLFRTIAQQLKEKAEM